MLDKIINKMTEYEAEKNKCRGMLRAHRYIEAKYEKGQLDKGLYAVYQAEKDKIIEKLEMYNEFIELLKESKKAIEDGGRET